MPVHYGSMSLAHVLRTPSSKRWWSCRSAAHPLGASKQSATGMGTPAKSSKRRLGVPRQPLSPPKHPNQAIKKGVLVHVWFLSTRLTCPKKSESVGIPSVRLDAINQASWFVNRNYLMFLIFAINLWHTSLNLDSHFFKTQVTSHFGLHTFWNRHYW
jgi:hypothetical protein